MRHKKPFFAVTLVLLLTAYAYVADQIPAGAQERGRGAASQMPAGGQASKLASGTTILADAKGMTLYTFMKDTEGKSNCNGQCERNWPPLTAATDAKPMAAWTMPACAPFFL